MTGHVRPGRVISVRYTAMVSARELGGQTLYGPTLRQALGEILRQVRREAHQVFAEALDLGRVSISETRAPGATVCLAVVWQGLTAAEIGAGLAKLAAEAGS
jgi:hypothetical protein